MARPAVRAVARRKDDADITFTAYNGETVTKKYQPIASFFPNKYGGLDVVFEKGVVVDNDTYFYNAYVEVPLAPTPKKGEGKAPAPKPAGKPAPDDSDLDF